VPCLLDCLFPLLRRALTFAFTHQLRSVVVIVTRYGGTIGVENAAGGGARFSIRFPIADPKNTEGRHA
jgi:hypothetical protein